MEYNPFGWFMHDIWGPVVFFNRAEWEVIREMSLAGSGLVLSPPPYAPGYVTY